MITAPWTDCEGLFRPGDYETAENGDEMGGRLEKLLGNPRRAEAQASQGLGTIRARHTCAHRLRELLAIVEESRECPRAWRAS